MDDKKRKQRDMVIRSKSRTVQKSAEKKKYNNVTSSGYGKKKPIVPS